MKLYAPDYYRDFRCIAGSCRHTCCVGWEIDIDEAALLRYESLPDIAANIDREGTPHIRLAEGERCPFLQSDGLCRMICRHGEEILCDICRDHPRFRNFFTGRTEVGLGLVCEEAARLILFSDHPLKLVLLEDDGAGEELPDDERELLSVREKLLSESVGNGPEARLFEYLVYRHLADALYDDRLAERIRLIREAHREVLSLWAKTDGTPEALIEAARAWSYDFEYDDEVIEKRLSSYE